MSKKVKIKSVFLVVFLVFVVLCVHRHYSLDVKTVIADRIIIANDVNQLIKESDLIVRATVLPNKENVLIYDKTDNSVTFGYNITQLEINEILKGKTTDQTIKITEEYYITNDIKGKTLWTQGAYMPAKENKEYLFFLKKYSNNDLNYSGMYFPIDLEKGKYVLDGDIDLNSIDDISEEKLEVFNTIDSKNYKKFYKEVMEKSKNKFQ